MFCPVVLGGTIQSAATSNFTDNGSVSPMILIAWENSGTSVISLLPPVTSVSVTGLTGATAGTRLAGSTSSGSPATGTFLTGDVVVDRTGTIWVCTASGSPGTWKAALVSPMTTLGDTIYGGASGAGTRLAGSTSATRQFLTQTGTGSVSAAPAWGTISAGDVPVLNQNTTGTASNITATLDQVPTAAANVALGSHKIISLANGTASTDAAAFGQLPSAGSPLPLNQGGSGVSAASDAALLTAIGAAPVASPQFTGTAPQWTDTAGLVLTAQGAQLSPTSPVSISSTSATSLGGMTVPAGDPAAGAIYRVTLFGFTTNSGTPTCTVDIRWGGTAGTLLCSVQVTLPALANAFWQAEALVTFTSTTACNAQLNFLINTAVGGGFAASSHLAGTASPVTVTTASSELLTIDATVSSTTGLTFTCLGGIPERVA